MKADGWASGLDADRLELLRYLLEREGDAPAAAPGIPRRPEGAAPPLSFAQQRLWFLDRLNPGTPLYNVARVFRLRGRLDVSALRGALAEVTRRHEALRTTFAPVEGRPFQVVAEPGPVPLPLVELGGLAATAREELARRLAADEARRPFDLAAGPLLRACLLRLDEEDVWLVVTLHHIVADGWSLPVLCRELGALYDAYASSLPASLPEPPVQYADFALWQRERLQGELLEEQLAWWRQLLAGCPQTLDLPTDRPRPPVQSLRGARRRRRLASGLGAAAGALARRHGTTPFAVHLAALGALLHRLTGHEDMLVGTPVANRTRPELADLIGHFANTLVLRLEAAGDPSFAAFLERVRDGVAGALGHQEVPFERLVEALQPERDLSYSPLFQVMFLIEEQTPVLTLGGLPARPLGLDPGTALTDLTLWLEEESDGALTATAEYAVELFDATTIDRLLDQLETLLAAALDDPAKRLSDLPLMSGAERAALRAEWNDTAKPVPEVAVHDLFAARAAAAPGAVALVCAGEEVTYGELRRLSGRLAGWLRALGVGPEARVGICLERSVEMVAAVLGVLEAGGAYVPLDPGLPRERLAFVLEDCGAAVLVTRRHLAASLPEHKARLALLDPSWEEAAPAAGGRGGVAPEQLAYVLYTSGSTGRPKGVQIPHRALVNLVAAMRRALGFGAADAMLAETTLSFDIAGLELLLPLTVGGRIVLATGAEAVDGRALAALLATSGATVAQGTPATWRLLLTAGWPGQEGLAMLCCGEILTPELAGRLLPRGAALWNCYGPTETTIYSTGGRVAAAAEAGSVGRAIDNTRIHVVDGRLRLLPAGVPGEVLIGGLGLARGYLGRPDLTAERFVPDPFSGTPGERLYRTGDLGRLRPDGRLEILGRLDHQVKLRGFRIELGEIEAALARHPTVRQAVAAVRDGGGPEDRRLVAWYVPRAEAPAESELRAFLRRHLPEYMVPERCIALPELPLNPSGKVDRRALREPAESPWGGGFIAARGRLERAIAAIWCEVLRRERVGVRDNFFDLGGHSLLLAEVQGLLASPAHGVERAVSMVDLFRCATIESLALHLGEAPAAETPPRRGHERAARRRAATREPVAVIGMAGRFPRARNLEELFANLCAGRECLSLLSDEELLADGADPEEIRDPRYVRARGLLEDVELFDAGFFGVTPREAEILDPQHRLFLECAWEALEDAGYDPQRYDGRVGVYAGAGLNAYLLHNLAGNPALMKSLGGFQTMIANDKDYLATRVSYKLDLRGPSLSVQTGCSASLVAVHLAVQGLLAGECDMALAGGVKVSVPQRAGHLYQEGGILSPDGHCRAFDARAQGTVGGSGVGLVVLKRLPAALDDGDRVRAVILGSAINNDGAGKVGFTAPSVDGQAEVIAEAHAVASVDPATIAYVEAHGTGTALGDPIEVAALAQAFGEVGGRRAFCALGSIKTNLGHLDTAAGIAGLIKTVLALEQGSLPPSLHFEEPNPEIDFAATPFYVNARLAPWPTTAGPRRAGVSSFGIGGTNAHVVLEEAPEGNVAAASDRPWQVLVLSARSETALAAAAARLADHLRRHPEVDLPDAAYTLQVGRAAFDHRLSLICQDAAEAADALAALDPARIAAGRRPAGDPPVVFLFPGQGAQHPGMAAELYRGEPVFRAAFDRCAERLAPELGIDLRRLVHPAAGEEEAAGEALDRTAFTQPALFAVEYALASLWMEWGVRPAAMIGHSVGELVAACLAGVFSLEDALDLVALRGRLVQELPGGAVLGVRLGEAELLPLLGEGLEIAAVNGPAQVSVAGAAAAVAALEERLTARGVGHRRLRASHAFHSAAVEPALGPFAAEVARRRPRPPRVPYLSNVTGDWVRPEEATDPAYWARHLRRPVRFAAGLAKLLEEPGRVLLEVGPGRTLAALVEQQPGREAAAGVLASLPHPKVRVSDHGFLLATLGRLWTLGAPVDWERFRHPSRRRVGLPTYPFERQRYWVEPAAGAEPARGQAAAASDEPAAPALALYARPRGGAPYAPPETEVEREIAEVWQEFLGIAPVGLDDDFFALGGDSLIATQVVTRLQELFPLELGLEALFVTPTVRALAAGIDAGLLSRLAEAPEEVRTLA